MQWQAGKGKQQAAEAGPSAAYGRPPATPQNPRWPPKRERDDAGDKGAGKLQFVAIRWVLLYNIRIFGTVLQVRQRKQKIIAGTVLQLQPNGPFYKRVSKEKPLTIDAGARFLFVSDGCGLCWCLLVCRSSQVRRAMSRQMSTLSLRRAGCVYRVVMGIL